MRAPPPSPNDSILPPGLTRAEAAQRLRREGPNELPRARAPSLPAIVGEVLAEPMILMLIAGAALYFVLGSRGDALILLVFVAAMAAITVFQRRKTERVLEALRDLSSPRALVMREGAELRIPGREVVRGDVLLLREGDRVAADASVLFSDGLRVDESLLTGESVPVGKRAATPDRDPVPQRLTGDGARQAQVFAGTLIVGGHGLAHVTESGAGTEMGRIGVSLRGAAREPTPLEHQTQRLVRNIAAIGLAVCILVAAVYGAGRGEWLGGFLAGLTLAMAILPEEFPMVLTIFLALGAWRISRERVLTRRASAIEALGSATVLCVDKTGTLTENHMMLQSVWDGQAEAVTLRQGQGALSESIRAVIRAAALASEPDAFDPMEKAVLEAARAQAIAASPDDRLLRHYPISAGLLALVHGWRVGDSHGLFAKGAPEAIALLCRLPGAQAQAMLARAQSMARSGLRVLGVAESNLADGRFPDAPAGASFAFRGLLGFADPVRATVPAAVSECRRAGIRVVMITGDYPETAMAIARDAGIANPGECLSGDQLAPLTDADLSQRLGRVNVFARIAPIQKLRIVQALKDAGEIVAMTGDGVNDAPALRAAHIGIAMGARGTDVAREAAALVLLDDDFVSIARAVRLGRRIFDNLRKAMSYILAVHIPTAGMTVITAVAGWPMVFFPVHIVFLELIIDPACSIAFEAERADPRVMERAPRDPLEPLFGGPVLAFSLLQGLIALAFVFAVYLDAQARGAGDDALRVVTFSAVVAANLCLIFINRGGGQGLRERLTAPNTALWLVVGGTLAAYALVLALPSLRALFQFAPLEFSGLGVPAIALFICVIALAIVSSYATRWIDRHAAAGRR